MQGGSCGAGFRGGLAGAVVSNYGPGSMSTGYGRFADRVVNTMVHAAVGGVAATMGGGRFADGARSAAFAYLFNEMAHRMGGPYGPGMSRDRRIYSAEYGVVETAGWENPDDHTQGYGFRLKIRTGSDESLFVYAHVDPDSIQVFEGLVVAKGEYIGQYASPANGGATGPHLHFEWWSKSGTRLDPAAYLPTVMPGHVLKDTIRFRSVHPVTGAARWHNGYDLIGPTAQ